MPLEPLFSLTPRNPTVNTYDPADTDKPWAAAYVWTHGGVTRPYYYSYSPEYQNLYYPSLSTAYDNDTLYLAGDAVDPSNHTLGNYQQNCIVQLSFYARNVSAENQFLNYWEVGGEGLTAQFFTNAQWVRNEELSGDEQVALLMDSPSEYPYVYSYVRLAHTYPYTNPMRFRRVECYLL